MNEPSWACCGCGRILGDRSYFECLQKEINLVWRDGKVGICYVLINVAGQIDVHVISDGKYQKDNGMVRSELI